MAKVLFRKLLHFGTLSSPRSFKRCWQSFRNSTFVHRKFNKTNSCYTRKSNATCRNARVRSRFYFSEGKMVTGKIQLLFDTSLVLEGMTRNASTHAAGIIIVPGELTDFIPMYKTPSTDLMTQFPDERY